MGNFLRWAAYALAGVLVLAVLFAGWVWVASQRTITAGHEGLLETLAKPTAEQLADASRQAQILGCFTCHGEGLRGDMVFDEPGVATVPAPNLTLIAAKATDQQLARAIRQGIGVDGRALFVMPSAQYSRLDDSAVAALIHVIRRQPRGGEQMPPISLGPLGRLGVAIGKFPSQVAAVDRYNHNMPADLGPQFAAGRRLAMVNCAECHGPAFGGDKPSPEIEAPDLAVVGAYDLAQFTRLLRTGRPPDGRDLGLMAEVAQKDFSHYTDHEIGQLYAYFSERARRAP